MTSAGRAWPAGAVTGIGSLPGIHPGEAAALVFGELSELPHLVELPARGAGADLIGRSAALLVDLPVEIVPSGWRLAAHPGRDLRRARDFLSWDLDALEAAGAGFTGTVKVQAAGPWTLAASLELANGHRLVSDHGAVRDLTESLAEGLRVHLAEVGRRLPGASVLLQVDEPSIPAVLDARIPTPSGYGTVRAVEAPVVVQRLHDVLDVAAAGRRVVHCCAADVPVTLLREAGADAVSLDAGLIGSAGYDALGEAVDAGCSLWLGVVATTGRASLDAARERLYGIWNELGFARSELAASVVPTPACGLAGLSAQQVRRVFAILRDLGSAILDDSAA